ncbi:uncharacterized protein LOC130788023 [Actinidia eriantha]|uniref:uncharacterized protein LOC130788023 n=1 Tax=Actinidia eriantha TaxID=165200 RepID=UPI00258FF15C|nr:uncharacterized protein LOC130788023 [Actinidia eriantha]
MATAFTSFRPALSAAAGGSNRRTPDPIKSSSSSSANWWIPIFGWSSVPDYITNKESEGEFSPAIEKESDRSRSRFAPGCFTEEKAKQLRKKTAETATFHDIMYHSAIASRLASDTTER